MDNPDGISSSANKAGTSIGMKLLNIALLIAPFLYLQILIMLNLLGHPGETETIPTVFNGYLTLINFLAIMLAFLAIISFLITYGFNLPFAWKDFDPAKPHEGFTKFFLALAMSEAVVIFGLILGLISWIFSGAVDWNLFIPFLAAGEGHLIYLYFFRIPFNYRFTLGGNDSPREIHIGSKEINKVIVAISAILLISLIIFSFIAYLGS